MQRATHSRIKCRNISRRHELGQLFLVSLAQQILRFPHQVVALVVRAELEVLHVIHHGFVCRGVAADENVGIAIEPVDADLVAFEV